MQKLSKIIIYLYQKMISPHMKFQCKFYPSCSQYALMAIKKYGLARGIVKSLFRIIKCTPFSRNRIDFP
ncbi:MAG: membrane protein insertion efficiency factor YidD [Holosporaceae bacterium]|nr:membrane protein insertion efficiency factor YidD [Holosporaceae bacterium]